MAMEPADQYAALESFVLDNPELENLEKRLSEFNLFSLLNLDGKEKIHSRVLEWLLNPRPQQAHDLGDDFLRQFLTHTLAKARKSGIETVLSAEASVIDWSGARVQWEWPFTLDNQQGRLDILILDERQKFLCAVENKIGSGEHSGQLNRYREALKERYPDPDFKRHYVLLSPNGASPKNETDREFWAALDYSTVCQLVEGIVADRQDSLASEVLAFIRQYAHILRRYIMDDTELENLAQNIYNRHKPAIDFIYKQRWYGREKVKEMLIKVIDGQKGWLHEDRGGREQQYTRFFPVEWKDKASFETGTGWGECKALALFQFECYKNRLFANIAISPSNDRKLREALVSCLSDVLDTAGGNNEKFDWFSIDENILEASDFEQWDEEAVRDKINKWVADFAKNEYRQIQEAVAECLAEH